MIYIEREIETMREIRAYYNIIYKEDDNEYLELITFGDKERAEQIAREMNEKIGYNKYYVK